jgi:uracil-DNA glycosylase family 4
MKAELLALCQRIETCEDCGLARTRTKAVPGEGPDDAEIMFIGEGPGYYEDRSGRPFVGQAGKLLERLLASIGMRREQVYITNVVKCRPPENRDPLREEIEACDKYLTRQIELIDPLLIVTLGRYSMAKFLPGESISRIHGQPRVIGRRTILPFFHPAAALHQQRFMQQVEQDFKKIPEVLTQARERRAREAAQGQTETQQAPIQGRLF